MKRLMFTVMAVGLLMACGGGSTDTMRRLQQAEDVVEEHPDSAAGLLSQVVTTGMTEEETALYGLLWTMAEYKKANYSINDSLISRSIDYYDKHGDAWHRGRAYYYRGGIRMRILGKMSDAVKDYKVAEAIAEDEDDELLKNMVYENLAFANYYCINHPLILEYSQKFLESSVKLNDSVMTMRGLQMCASAYSTMQQKDSAYAYVVKSLDYIDLADSILRADIYFNVAVMYQEKGDEENARKYLEIWKSDKFASSFKGYITEARLLKAQGRYEEAIEQAKKCATEKDPLVRINSMELLSELYELTGDKGKALEVKRQVDEHRDSIMKANNSLEIADWQRKFDEERWEKRSQQRMKETGAVIAVIFVVLVLGIWWHQRRRVHQLGFRLDENARRITENQAEIERLQQGDEASEKTIANLRRQIEDSRQRIASKLLTGTQQFVKLQQKECVGDMTAEEQQCLVDYFAQLRPKRWQEWERRYSGLSTAQYIFLIMQDDLHFDDEAIATALNVKRTSVRSMRSRIKGRER